MKITKIYDGDVEPTDCVRCGTDFRGININLSLFKEYTIRISLCEDCINKLRVNLIGEI